MKISTNIEQLRKKYRSDNFIAFTIDIDWASEDSIREITDFFIGNEIPVNIFCTHPSAVLAERKESPLVELGIHPNYSDGSSHGNTMDEITDYCMNLVPDARSVRGHRWFNSNDMYDRLIKRGILYDSSECSMMDRVEPYIHRSGLLRFPVFFEDGGMLWNGMEPDFKSNGRKYFSQDGLKVLDLHPIHFAINSPTDSYYRQVADGISRQEYNTMNSETILRLRYAGKGIRNYVMELVEFVKTHNVNVVSLGQIYDELEYYES